MTLRLKTAVRLSCAELLPLLLFLSGCASSGDKSGPPGAQSVPTSRFLTTDNRTIEIGKATPVDGGRRYDNPHMEKGKCWVADDFNFTGYDTLYIAPTLSTAKFPDKPEDSQVHALAKENLVTEFKRMVEARGLFPNIVTRESDIKPGAKVLKLENTITEFSKGGGAGRYFAGLYGAGQPVLRVQGKMTDGAKTVFTFEARRSGASAGARLGGGYMRDEDVQIGDIRSLVLDVTDFMAALAGKYQAKG